MEVPKQRIVYRIVLKVGIIMLLIMRCNFSLLALIVATLMFCSCNTKTDEVKNVKISEKYPDVEVKDQHAVGINGESLNVQSAVVNDTLIAITVEPGDVAIEKNISQCLIFAKDPKGMQEQTPDGLVVNCDGSRTWMFYATLGSPIEEQVEPQSVDYHPTTFLVVSEYLDYNGTIYKHE